MSVSFSKVDVCEPVKWFINWIASNLNFKRPVNFTYQNDKSNGDFNIYFRTDKNIIEEKEEHFKKPHFLQFIADFPCFGIIFPSNDEHRVNIQYLAISMIKAGITFDLSQYPDGLEKTIFAQSFTQFVGYVFSNLTTLTIFLNNLSFVAKPKNPFGTYLELDTYFESTKQKIIDLMPMEGRKYSIQYKFMKSIEKFPSLTSNIDYAFRRWLSDHQMWIDYCADAKIPTVEIYHDEHDEMMKNPIFFNAIIIRNKNYGVFKNKYFKFVKEQIEKKYSIVIPNDYNDFIYDIVDWFYSEDDYFEFKEANPQWDIPHPDWGRIVCLERNTKPMIVVEDLVNRIQNEKHFIDAIKYFPTDPTKERYKDIKKMKYVNEKILANTIMNCINNFKFGDVYSFWMNEYNELAQKSDITRRIIIITS